MKVFTTGDVASFCNVTHRCILQWIKEGRIKTFKTPGNHNRIKEKDLLDFLKAYNMPVPTQLKGGSIKRKLLIIDDDKNEISSIKRLLSKEKGYIVEFAYNGFEAAQKLYDVKPDLVVVDIRMPGMDGYDVIRYIKDISGDDDIKIIAFSGFFTESGKKKCIETGADKCLDKPYKPKDLLSSITELV
ncbi:MAG: response regulator [Candidatus Omnitrophica bacterium]|nr:response regulator [Candidatus Omnitrophota bacterium]